VARVDSLAGGDARIGGEAAVELAVADVDADDAGGAAPEQHVGEASRALADVEADPAADVDRAVPERGVELQAAARDEPQLGIVDDLDLGGVGKLLAGLARHRPARTGAPADAAALDQPLRRRAARRHAALHQQLVGTHRRHPAQ
jgi:hypothetical protein